MLLFFFLVRKHCYKKIVRKYFPKHNKKTYKNIPNAYLCKLLCVEANFNCLSFEFHPSGKYGFELIHLEYLFYPLSF